MGLAPSRGPACRRDRVRHRAPAGSGAGWEAGDRVDTAAVAVPYPTATTGRPVVAATHRAGLLTMDPARHIPHRTRCHILILGHTHSQARRRAEAAGDTRTAATLPVAAPAAAPAAATCWTSKSASC